MSNKICIQAFGIARDLLGQSTLLIEVPAHGTVGELRTFLLERYPGMGKLKSLAIAVNAEYADDSRIIGPADEVVLIPPVSGG